MPSEVTDWMNITQAAGLKPLKIKGHTLLPIVQGGMGVGVSASGLASAVARMGGMGTISAVDLRRRHPDLMMDTKHLDKRTRCRRTH
jgi:nitronate monooxygenase